MAAPRLTFFCELETEPLQAMLDAHLIADLAAMKANLSLGIIDLSPERAEVVQRLNRAGVPVIAWLLLPKDQGYWFNLDNAPQAAIRYVDFIAWTSEHNLRWAGIGLDIEPDIREITQFAQGQWQLLPRVLRRLVDIPRMKRARAAYMELVVQMHADGYAVDCYQFPVIADERMARSTLLQRAAGLVDLPVDREVLMLYTSFVRPNGAGLLASYTPEAQSVGLGSTGGGVDADFGNFKPLTWDEMARDLRLAWHWSDDLHIFSLEGCVRQGFMEHLKNFVWDYPILLPDESLARVNNWRSALRSILWTGAHFTAFVLLTGAVLISLKWARRYLKSS